MAVPVLGGGAGEDEGDGGAACEGDEEVDGGA